MSTPPTGRPYVLTFNDLVYAALSAYTLERVADALGHHDAWPVAYLAAGTVWLFYDWYANHYFQSDLHLGGVNLPIDFLAFVQYAGLLYAAFKASPWLFVFMAIRGFRGILHNEVARRLGAGETDPERRHSYNYSSGFMVLAYLPLFFIDRHYRPWGVGWRLAIAIGVWLVAYAIALLIEARLDRAAAAAKHTIDPSLRQEVREMPGSAERPCSTARRSIIITFGVGIALAALLRAATRSFG